MSNSAATSIGQTELRKQICTPARPAQNKRPPPSTTLSSSGHLELARAGRRPHSARPTQRLRVMDHGHGRTRRRSRSRAYLERHAGAARRWEASELRRRALQETRPTRPPSSPGSGWLRRRTSGSPAFTSACLGDQLGGSRTRNAEEPFGGPVPRPCGFASMALTRRAAARPRTWCSLSNASHGAGKGGAG